MRTISLLLMYKPGKSHLGSIMLRAERAKEFGALTDIPTLMVEECSLGGEFHTVKVLCKDEDAGFWLGFMEGMDFCINNREITVGTDLD